MMEWVAVESRRKILQCSGGFFGGGLKYIGRNFRVATDGFYFMARQKQPNSCTN